MKKIEKVFIVGIILVAGIFVVVSLFDFFKMSTNFENYIRTYHIADDAPHIQFKSSMFFVVWRMVQFLFNVLIIYFGILLLREKVQKIKWVFYSFVFLSAFWIIRYYSLWVLSGYDHYPGFDPYLF